MEKMRSQILRYLKCPRCGGELEIIEASNENKCDIIIEGKIKCIKCGKIYQIREGIVFFE